MSNLKGRLKRIIRAQECGGPEGGLPEITPFLLLAFFLEPDDLDTIRPHLDPPRPDLLTGEVGRYRGVAVFPKDSPAAARWPPQGLTDGVAFSYAPADHVLMGDDIDDGAGEW